MRDRTAPIPRGGWQSLTLALFRRIEDELSEALGGATPAELRHRAAPDANPIGWLAWHLTRSHDRNLSEIAGVDQCWIGDGWHARFGMAADPSETGFGHTSRQVEEFAVALGAEGIDGDGVIAYHRAVMGTVTAYLLGAPDDDLDRVAPSPTLGTSWTVQRRLVGAINEGFQHLGQLRAAR